MKFHVSIAERRADVLRCQYFIAESYNKNYDIMFSEDIYDLDARIEPYPQRYLMGTVNGELVAALGLYTRDTYVERYGGVTDEEIQAHLVEAGVADQYEGAVKREVTKLVVKEGWQGFGFIRILHLAAHSRQFLDADAAGPVLVLGCAKVSFLRNIFAPRGRIGSHFLAPFPRYPIHSDYRSEKDPMESRLIIPEVDVPPDVRALTLPLDYEVPDRASKAES